MKPTQRTLAEQWGGSQALRTLGVVPRVDYRHELRQCLAPAWCIAVGDLRPDVAHERAQFPPRHLLLLATDGTISQMPVEPFVGEGRAEAVDASAGDALRLTICSNIPLQVFGDGPAVEPDVGIVSGNRLQHGRKHDTTGRIEFDDAFLAAFGAGFAHGDRTGGTVDVLLAQAYQLGPAQAGGPRQPAHLHEVGAPARMVAEVLSDPIRHRAAVRPTRIATHQAVVEAVGHELLRSALAPATIGNALLQLAVGRQVRLDRRAGAAVGLHVVDSPNDMRRREVGQAADLELGRQAAQHGQAPLLDTAPAIDTVDAAMGDGKPLGLVAAAFGTFFGGLVHVVEDVRDLLLDAGNTHRWCSFTHEIGPLAPAIRGSAADRECGSEREKRRCLARERFSRRILRLYIAPGTKPGLLCMCQVVRHPPKRNLVAALGNALAGRMTSVIAPESHVTDEQQTSTEAPDVHRCDAGQVAAWPSRDGDTAGPFRTGGRGLLPRMVAHMQSCPC